MVHDSTPSTGGSQSIVVPGEEFVGKKGDLKFFPFTYTRGIAENAELSIGATYYATPRGNFSPISNNTFAIKWGYFGEDGVGGQPGVVDRVRVDEVVVEHDSLGLAEAPDVGVGGSGPAAGVHAVGSDDGRGRAGVDAGAAAAAVGAGGLGRAARYLLAQVHETTGDSFPRAVLERLPSDPLGAILARRDLPASAGDLAGAVRASVAAAFAGATCPAAWRRWSKPTTRASRPIEF